MNEFLKISTFLLPEKQKQYTQKKILTNNYKMQSLRCFGIRFKTIPKKLVVYK